MRTIRRGLRTILRNPLRTGMLVAVLAVSIALTLIMITVNEAFGQRLDEIRAEVGTNIDVNPAGSFRGLLGGGDPLSEEEIDQLALLNHVESVQRTLSVPYSGEALESAIDVGELGNRLAGGDGATDNAPDGNAPGGQGFSIPVFFTGTDDPLALSTIGNQDAELIEGRTFTDDEAEASVAVLGDDLAEKNGLLVGDTFELEDGSTIEVIGTFTSGTQFGDNAVFMPLITVQRLFDSEGELTLATVRVDTVENVDAVADAITETLGEDTVDVVTEASRFESISAPVADAEDSSQIALIAALVASATVILFSVGLVARQRVKEIGIFKAIGASNWHVTAQFGIEAAVISVIAALIGALATFPLAQTVANGLVSDPAAPAGPGGFAGPAGAQLQGAGGFLGDVDVAVSPEVFLYALGIAIGLAVIASIIPAWYVGRVKPAEVLRYE
ncbi:MAG: ABC transporter permease [Chloroflexi bacterium]|nr:ABC transporter permease [Chloroflexota bacterium]